MIRYKLLIFAALFSCASVSAQLSLEKKIELITEVNESILSEDFADALAVLKELRESGVSNANLDYKTGLCYLNTVTDKLSAVSFLEIASQHISKNYNAENALETNAPAETFLCLGDAYRLENKFDAAINAYNKYMELVNGNLENRSIAFSRIQECRNAKILEKFPVDVKWKNLGELINQGIGNLNPVLSGDGKMLVFTRKMKFYDAVLISQLKDGSWQEPSNITTQIGSDGEFYPTGLSSDGKKMLLTTYGSNSGQDIYESELVKDRWSKVRKLPAPVNTDYAEINAVYSPDGSSLYFASNRNGGFGGFDIYVCRKKADGSWDTPVNMGPGVNTKENEKLPRITPDGKKLIFSSQGHFNMGGYDLFYIDLPVNNAASKPYNVGYPINTVDNDLSFYPSASNEAYLARFMNGNTGETDIYQINYTSFSKYRDIPVKSKISTEGINGDTDSILISLIDKSLSDTIETFKTTPASGEARFSLYPGNFALLGEKGDIKSESTDFAVPVDAQDGVIDIPLTLRFKQAVNIAAVNNSKADSLFISSITFEFDKYLIETTSSPLLDRIAEMLKKYPSVTLAITGYTDALGKAPYNKQLSQKRANAVKEYLVSQGVDKSRVKASGAGNSLYVAINTNSDGTDNPNGRQFNRRVEFEFLNLPAELVVVKKYSIPESLRIKSN